MQKILYVDMDNVLVDFQSAFSRIPAEVLSEF
jgi:beta-phosphoglucomutase-like phosphatase (HAD superfamily)